MLTSLPITQTWCIFSGGHPSSHPAGRLQLSPAAALRPTFVQVAFVAAMYANVTTHNPTPKYFPFGALLSQSVLYGPSR